MTAETVRSSPRFQLTHQDQTALWAACQRQWKRIRVRLSWVNLPSQEWEDIESIARIKVFDRVTTHFDPDKGSIDPWCFIVMLRSTQNELRRLLPNLKAKDKTNHQYRANLIKAKPIHVRVTEIGRWGEEVVVVEPDILDPQSVANTPDWSDFALALNREERSQLAIFLSGGSCVDAGNRHKSKRPKIRTKEYGKTAANGRKALHRIAAKYRDWLNRSESRDLPLTTV